MHISPFSDAAGVGDMNRAAVAHRDGLLRGIAVLGIFGLLIGLTCVGNALNAIDADAAPIACRPAARATSIFVGHACGVRRTGTSKASVGLRP